MYCSAYPYDRVGFRNTQVVVRLLGGWGGGGGGCGVNRSLGVDNNPYYSKVISNAKFKVSHLSHPPSGGFRFK